MLALCPICTIELLWRILYPNSPISIQYGGSGPMIANGLFLSSACVFFMFTNVASNPRERYYHRQMAIHASKYKHFI
jgi:hypothetical protein